MDVEPLLVYVPVVIETKIVIAKELSELIKIAKIISQCVRREVALIAEMIDISLDELVHLCWLLNYKE